MSNLLQAKQLRGLIELATLDQSADYETDVTELFYDSYKEEFVLLLASGCSCWDGEYDELRFKTLKDVEKELAKEEYKYSPSIEGAKKLLADAKVAYKKIK